MRNLGESPPQPVGFEAPAGHARRGEDPGGSPDPQSEFEIRLRTHRRTALVELFGELDLVTVTQVAEAFDTLSLDTDGFRHVVVDLRGLTFMDANGIHELVRQSNDAHQNRHNLAIVKGRESISRMLAIAAVDTSLVLVESPEDLVPPVTPPQAELPARVA